MSTSVFATTPSSHSQPVPFSPKIQRLVTPVRLQRRRHLRAIKVRRIERQREQKTEYECVSSFCILPSHRHLKSLSSARCSPSVLPRRRRRSPPSRRPTRSASSLSPLTFTPFTHDLFNLTGLLECIFLGLLFRLSRWSLLCTVDAILPCPPPAPHTSAPYEPAACPLFSLTVSTFYA